MINCDECFIRVKFIASNILVMYGSVLVHSWLLSEFKSYMTIAQCWMQESFVLEIVQDKLKLATFLHVTNNGSF